MAAVAADQVVKADGVQVNLPQQPLTSGTDLPFNISATTPMRAKAVASIGMLTVIPTVLRRIPVEI